MTTPARTPLPVPLSWAWGHFSVVYKQALITIATEVHGDEACRAAMYGWTALPQIMRESIYSAIACDAVPYFLEHETQRGKEECEN